MGHRRQEPEHFESHHFSEAPTLTQLCSSGPYLSPQSLTTPSCHHPKSQEKKTAAPLTSLKIKLKKAPSP